jgi:hypothetical protein
LKYLKPDPIFCSLINQMRAIALETDNGRIVLGIVDKKGYGFDWTDDVNGGIDPRNRLILLPRAFWEDTPWTMIHEGTHLADEGKYTADKGWRTFRYGEIRAFGSELGAYEQFQKIHPGYETPGAKAIQGLWHDPPAFYNFLNTTYKPIWEKAVQDMRGN